MTRVGLSGQCIGLPRLWQNSEQLGVPMGLASARAWEASSCSHGLAADKFHSEDSDVPSQFQLELVRGWKPVTAIERTFRFEKYLFNHARVRLDVPAPRPSEIKATICGIATDFELAAIGKPRFFVRLPFHHWGGDGRFSSWFATQERTYGICFLVFELDDEGRVGILTGDESRSAISRECCFRFGRFFRFSRSLSRKSMNLRLLPGHHFAPGRA